MVIKCKEESEHLTNLGEIFAILRMHKLCLNASKCSFGIGSEKFLGYMITHRGIEVNPDQIKAIHDLHPPRNPKEVQRLTGMTVRTYVFHLLRTYVILLCNWLILWQNVLYLYLGRSRMCLILQETCCSNLVLKPWRLDQETNEEKLFTKARQIARHLRTDSSIAGRQIAIYRD